MDIRRTDRPQELELDLPAAHSAGRMGRQLARDFALSEGIPAPEVETLEFVTGELLDNAVDHGGGDAAREVADLKRDVRMRLLLQLGEGRWQVTVCDQGGGDAQAVREGQRAGRTEREEAPGALAQERDHAHGREAQGHDVDAEHLLARGKPVQDQQGQGAAGRLD